MAPVLSLEVKDGEQGNNAVVILSLQNPTPVQVILPMETQEAIQEWLVAVFNSDAQFNRIEIYPDGEYNQG